VATVFPDLDGGLRRRLRRILLKLGLFTNPLRIA
jgi:hypothetical protein